MEKAAHRPRLAVVVANGITGDSRVQKTAIAAARAGWDVTLIGAGGHERKIRVSKMGPVEVLRVPVPNVFAQRGGHRLRKLVTQFGIPDARARTRAGAMHDAWVRKTSARVGQLRATEGAVRPLALAAGDGLRAVIRGRSIVVKARLNVYAWEQSREIRPNGHWRHDCPGLIDLDLAFGPAIERLKPDLIHANDITMIHTVAMSVSRMRARGEKVAWLYDAHEYVNGVDWPRADFGSAYRDLERTFIREADAVVTVSPEIAEMLRADYELPATPLVVRNTPIRETIGTLTPRPSVRKECGLKDDVPLLVYSGWLSPERGLGVAVTALPSLPGVHLAIVSAHRSEERTLLLKRASDLGVRDRIHVVPYVPQYAVPDYLSTADLGLICSQHSVNYEVSLPTKLSEYLHGGVPMVVSDVKTLSAFVEGHGVGVTFIADDPVTFADAVRRGLARRAEMSANITEAMLDELSWEKQTEGLLALYRDISPRHPSDSPPQGSWIADERQVLAPPPELGDRASASWRTLSQGSVIRLGLGPANYAGQLAAFAQAICRDRPDVSAEVTMRRASPTLIYPADVYLDPAKYENLAFQLEQVQHVLGRLTHLIADAFLPVFGNLNGDNIENDLPALRRAGIKVALLGHGSEVRQPARHMAMNEYSLFFDAPEGMVARLTAIAERNRRVAEESGLPMFVTTPDLLDDLPWATWAPLVVDVDAWATDRPVMERKTPVVLHAPSARWTKGTARILPVLEDLAASGAIELKLIEKLSWSQMREQIQNSDLVVDQVTTGSYGTLAIEAMAAGRPVMAYLSEGIAARIGEAPPIVNVTPATLRGALESLLDDRDAVVRLSEASVDFVRRNHDGHRTAKVFDSFLR